MGKFTLKELQAYLRMKYIDNNENLQEFTTESMSISLFMKLVEEVGEVSEVLNTRSGREFGDRKSELAKELSDVIHYVVSIAAINDIDLEEVMLNKDESASVRYNQKPNFKEYLENDDKKR